MLVIRKKTEKKIKKTILDLGTHFARLEVREISEACHLDPLTISKVVVQMINAQQIYAEYFKSTRTVAFDKQANIERIDSLLGKFENLKGIKEEKIS
jgi:hypothetical protein